MRYEFTYRNGWDVHAIDEKAEAERWGQCSFQIACGLPTFEDAIRAATFHAGKPLTFVARAI